MRQHHRWRRQPLFIARQYSPVGTAARRVPFSEDGIGHFSTLEALDNDGHDCMNHCGAETPFRALRTCDATKKKEYISPLCIQSLVQASFNALPQFFQVLTPILGCIVILVPCQAGHPADAPGHANSETANRHRPRPAPLRPGPSSFFAACPAARGAPAAAASGSWRAGRSRPRRTRPGPP